jgi:hypothetical protein
MSDDTSRHCSFTPVERLGHVDRRLKIGVSSIDSDLRVGYAVQYESRRSDLECRAAIDTPPTLDLRLLALAFALWFQTAISLHLRTRLRLGSPWTV